MSRQRLLCYRAGATARRMIANHGLAPEMIGAVVGPASGPKWLVLAGIDRALIASGWLRRRAADRLLLAGASAGAWRMAALAAADAERCHAELEEGYITQVYRRGAGPDEVSCSIDRMLRDLFPRRRVRRLLDGSGVDLAVHLCRVRSGLTGRRGQAAVMAVAAASNLVSARTQSWLFERVLLHTRPGSFAAPFRGAVGGLDEDNFHAAVVATGSVPLYMEAVDGIAGAPEGSYLDGGLTDYHLNQDYLGGSDGIVLMPHFQRRVVPNWFDRWLSWRRPPRPALDRLLQLHPSPAFVAGLPRGRIPTRQDFIELADRPEARIDIWRRVVELSDRLGAELLDDLEHGRVPALLEPVVR